MRAGESNPAVSSASDHKRGEAGSCQWDIGSLGEVHSAIGTPVAPPHAPLLADLQVSSVMVVTWPGCNQRCMGRCNGTR